MEFCRLQPFSFHWPSNIAKILSYRPICQPLNLKSPFLSKRYYKCSKTDTLKLLLLSHPCITSLSEWNIHLGVISYSLTPSIPRILTILLNYSFHLSTVYSFQFTLLYTNLYELLLKSTSWYYNFPFQICCGIILWYTMKMCLTQDTLWLI